MSLVFQTITIKTKYCIIIHFNQCCITNLLFCYSAIDACLNTTCPDNSRCLNKFGHVMCACDVGYQRNENGTCDGTFVVVVVLI